MRLLFVTWWILSKIDRVAGLVMYSVLILARLLVKLWVRASRSTRLILEQSDLSEL